jgi:high affinity Mn2+ porin
MFIFRRLANQTMRIKTNRPFEKLGITAIACATTTLALAQEAATNSVAAPEKSPAAQPQDWNWHVQNTDIVQGYPGFAGKSPRPGFNSLPNGGETRETVSLDALAGVRLWHGAEAHIDGLMWQGFGVNDALGVDGFPNGEAFRLGTQVPNVNIPRLFIRQTIGFGGEQESIADDQLTLAGQQDVSRLTVTVGKFTPKDIFDNNAYANDPRTQFMNWGLMANEAWDYPADALGYITGLAVELNQPGWTVRYGFFQMPRESNGTALDGHFLEAWGMVTELERRYTLAEHPGTIRLLAFVNHANMGSYQEAINTAVLEGQPADIDATHEYRYKYGFGLNWEQEIIKNAGVFSRVGWSDGQNEAWVFSDVDRTASLGVSVKGEAWHRPGDTVGLAGLANGLSQVHQEFFAAGGTGILAGDGSLNYSWEKILETYCDCQLWKTIHASLDYQFVANPAFNSARGPVSVFGARLHWEF